MSKRDPTVSVSWTPPPPEWLVYNNCTAAAPWLAKYSSMYEGGDISWTGVPLELAINYLRSMIPSNWTKATDVDLLSWYEERTGGLQPGGVTKAAMMAFPIAHCGEELCHELQWQGDPDLAGVGAMISYFILAFFATFYFLILFADTISRARQKTGKRSNTVVFFVSGFQKSLSTFQDAVLLFAISINVAAMTRWLAPIVHPNSSHAYYGLLNSVFMSSFSVFPAISLQSLTPGFHHRRGIRLSLWSLTIVFVVVVEVMYRYIYMGDYFLQFWNQKVQFNEDIWLEHCDSLPLRVAMGYLTMVGHVFLTINCLWWLYHALSGVRRGRHVRRIKDKLANPKKRVLWRERWEQWQVYLRLANGFASLVFMWFFLVLFTAYREDVRKRAGPADQDSEWTFGQVLSLATWAPVGVELITVYLCGSLLPRLLNLYLVKTFVLIYMLFYPDESKEDDTQKRPASFYMVESPSSSESHLHDKRLFAQTLETITLDDDDGTHFRRPDDRPWSPLPSTYAKVRTHNLV